jgi:hypothetical protein
VALLVLARSYSTSKLSLGRLRGPAVELMAPGLCCSAAPVKAEELHTHLAACFVCGTRLVQQLHSSPGQVEVVRCWMPVSRLGAPW